MIQLKPKAIDATPERLAKGDHTAMVNPAILDSAQPIGLTRRITTSTIDRWKRQGLLSERQMVAINHCQGLWDRMGGSHGLVMDLDKISGLQGGLGTAQQEAFTMIAEYERRFNMPEYWACFENVVRWDEPGGVAGSRFAADRGRASQSAVMCVRFVADKVCEWNGY